MLLMHPEMQIWKNDVLFANARLFTQLGSFPDVEYVAVNVRFTPTNRHRVRETCGISQAEAEEFHDARLDTVKSWCSDRRPAPDGVINELKALARGIHQAGVDHAEMCKQLVSGGVLMIGIPHDNADARVCGFPSLEAHMRATAIAISLLPDDWQIR
jgi:hypothetical protein